MHAIIARYDTSSLWCGAMFLSGWTTLSRIGNGARRVLYVPNSDAVTQATRFIGALGRPAADEIMSDSEMVGEREKFLTALLMRDPRNTTADNHDLVWHGEIQLTAYAGKATLALHYGAIALSLRERGVQQITIVLHESFGSKVARDIMKVIRVAIPGMKVCVVLHNDACKTRIISRVRRIRS